MGTVVLLAATFVAVDYGWYRDDAERLVYVVQVDPDQLATLRPGEDLASTLPPQLPRPDRVIVRVGRGPVPQIGLPTATETLTHDAKPSATPANRTGERSTGASYVDELTSTGQRRPSGSGALSPVPSVTGLAVDRASGSRRGDLVPSDMVRTIGGTDSGSSYAPSDSSLAGNVTPLDTPWTTAEQTASRQAIPGEASEQNVNESGGNASTGSGVPNWQTASPIGNAASSETNPPPNSPLDASHAPASTTTPASASAFAPTNGSATNAPAGTADATPERIAAGDPYARNGSASGGTTPGGTFPANGSTFAPSAGDLRTQMNQYGEQFGQAGGNYAAEQIQRGFGQAADAMRLPGSTSPANAPIGSGLSGGPVGSDAGRNGFAPSGSGAAGNGSTYPAPNNTYPANNTGPVPSLLGEPIDRRYGSPSPGFTPTSPSPTNGATSAPAATRSPARYGDTAVPGGQVMDESYGANPRATGTNPAYGTGTNPAYGNPAAGSGAYPGGATPGYGGGTAPATGGGWQPNSSVGTSPINQADAFEPRPNPLAGEPANGTGAPGTQYPPRGGYTPNHPNTNGTNGFPNTDQPRNPNAGGQPTTGATVQNPSFQDGRPYGANGGPSNGSGGLTGANGSGFPSSDNGSSNPNANPNGSSGGLSSGLSGGRGVAAPPLSAEGDFPTGSSDIGSGIGRPENPAPLSGSTAGGDWANGGRPATSATDVNTTPRRPGTGPLAPELSDDGGIDGPVGLPGDWATSVPGATGSPGLDEGGLPIDPEFEALQVTPTDLAEEEAPLPTVQPPSLDGLGFEPTPEPLTPVFEEPKSATAINAGYLILATLGLIGSLGLNAYMGWVVRGIYLRYRHLVRDRRLASIGTS